MNIFIENAETFEFLTSHNTWTKTTGEAREFAATATAFAVARKEVAGKFNIVGHVTETKQLVNLDSGRGKAAENVTN